jgi:hypothetical protein
MKMGMIKKKWMSSVQLWNTNNNINLDCKNQDTRSEPKQVIHLNFLDLEE